MSSACSPAAMRAHPCSCTGVAAANADAQPGTRGGPETIHARSLAHPACVRCVRGRRVSARARAASRNQRAGEAASRNPARAGGRGGVSGRGQPGDAVEQRGHVDAQGVLELLGRDRGVDREVRAAAGQVLVDERSPCRSSSSPTVLISCRPGGRASGPRRSGAAVAGLAPRGRDPAQRLGRGLAALDDRRPTPRRLGDHLLACWPRPA